MQALDAMIASGNYKLLLDAVKGFRNGLVYGIRVRAPHALVMTLLWSRGPIPEMAMKIYRAARQHGMNLAKFAFTYKIGVALLAMVTGPQAWHSAVMGAVCGALYWGDRSPVNVQVNMYLLSRILSGFIHLYFEKKKVTPSPLAFKLYAATMWACVMYLFFHHPNVLQVSLQSSMNYIYHDSDKYTGVKDLVLVNKA
jgi:peroxisomal membrane protein 4